MKVIIWIVILAVIAWGIWYFMKDNNATSNLNGNAAGQVEGTSDEYNANVGAGANLNIGAEDSKG